MALQTVKIWKEMTAGSDLQQLSVTSMQLWKERERKGGERKERERKGREKKGGERKGGERKVGERKGGERQEGEGKG